MKERGHLSRWKSVEAERRFRAMEDDMWRELWPVPPAAMDIDTRLGQSRVYRWPGDGDPVVFLHGAGGTSLMWSRYVALLPGRTVYAVDTIGDVGRSRQRVLAEDAGDLATWLDEVLAGAGLSHAHLAGASYGGFLALNLAIRRPARVLSVALVEPAGLVPLRLVRFLAWGFGAMFASWLPRPMRRAAGRALRMPLLEDKRILRMALYGQLNHRSRLVRPGPFDDEQLRSTAVPVLLLLGERSEIYRSAEVLARATELMPRVDAEVIPDAGHALPVSHPEHVAARIDAFVDRSARSPDE